MMNGRTSEDDYENKRTRLSLARNAVLLADHDQVLRDSRDVVKALNRRTFGGDYMPDDDDGTNIHIGDITNQPGPQVTKTKQGVSPLVGGLIGAGLLAIGSPLALLAWDAVTSRKPVAPVSSPTFTDTNTKYEIRLLP